MAEEVTISSRTADRLPQIMSEEVRKILDSDDGLKILSDAFFTSAHIAFVTKSNGGTDEFGRLQFLDVESNTPGLKTVDPRTVEYAIIDNVRYELK